MKRPVDSAHGPDAVPRPPLARRRVGASPDWDHLGADAPRSARHAPSELIGAAFGDVLGAAQEGADWAVAVLYRSIQPRLLQFLRARAGDDAEDIASQTWFEVARSLNRFSGNEDDLRALMFTVARRRLSDHRRTSRRRPADLAGDTVLAALPAAGDPEAEALASLQADEASRRIAELLPADQAEIVLLRVVAGLSVEEVAGIVGKRSGTVRVLQHRALRRLAHKLGDGL